MIQKASTELACRTAGQAIQDAKRANASRPERHVIGDREARGVLPAMRLWKAGANGVLEMMRLGGLYSRITMGLRRRLSGNDEISMSPPRISAARLTVDPYLFPKRRAAELPWGHSTEARGRVLDKGAHMRLNPLQWCRVQRCGATVAAALVI